VIDVAVTSFPFKDGVCLGCGSDKHRGIAGAPGGDPVRHSLAGDALGGVDDLANANAVPRAEVEGARCAAIHEVQGRREVGAREIRYMDVVANTCAIRRWIVTPEYVEAIYFAIGRHQGAGNEVGFGVMALTRLTFRVATAGIEVA
jgi:hypothetical protein